MLLRDVEQKCTSEVNTCSESKKYNRSCICLFSITQFCRSLSSQIVGTSPNATRKYKELEQSFSEVGQVSHCYARIV